MLGNIPGNIKLKNVVILILLIELLRCLLDTFDNFNSPIASNQVKVKCLSFFVLLVLEPVRMIF